MEERWNEGREKESKLGNKRTNSFTQGYGVRLGCSLSPALFSLCIHELVVLLEQSVILW